MLTVTSRIFSSLFLLEMILKIIGLGFKGYIRDRFNIFDALIVLASTIELCFQLAATSNVPIQNMAAISVFRVFRIMRLLKLLKSATKL